MPEDRICSFCCSLIVTFVNNICNKSYFHSHNFTLHCSSLFVTDQHICSQTRGLFDAEEFLQFFLLIVGFLTGDWTLLWWESGTILARLPLFNSLSVETDCKHEKRVRGMTCNNLWNWNIFVLDHKNKLIRLLIAIQLLVVLVQFLMPIATDITSKHHTSPLIWEKRGHQQQTKPRKHYEHKFGGKTLKPPTQTDNTHIMEQAYICTSQKHTQ